LAFRRLHEGEDQKHQQGADRQATGRIDLGPADALQMDPEDEQQNERDCDVNEGEQGEEAVVEQVGRQEISHHRHAEDRQPVEPFARRLGDVLRQHVPYQPIARYAGDEGPSSAPCRPRRSGAGCA
jgi:hypothetical protein